MEVVNSRRGEILNKIEYISIDLWKPYKSLVKKLMPNAQVVSCYLLKNFTYNSPQRY
ncbi:transposase [Pleurocapsa sp. FMAR1]|uniref:transposase n=1 Tax=Pleurocapsa sp. FMAR1 TaxID=3040204 RepID=UPI0039AFA842